MATRAQQSVSVTFGFEISVTDLAMGLTFGVAKVFLQEHFDVHNCTYSGSYVIGNNKNKGAAGRRDFPQGGGTEFLCNFRLFAQQTAARATVKL